MARQKCERIGVNRAGNRNYYGVLIARSQVGQLNINYFSLDYDTEAEAAEDVNRLAEFLNLQGRAR